MSVFDLQDPDAYPRRPSGSFQPVNFGKNCVYCLSPVSSVCCLDRLGRPVHGGCKAAADAELDDLFRMAAPTHEDYLHSDDPALD